jgi:hypothetical protein
MSNDDYVELCSVLAQCLTQQEIDNWSYTTISKLLLITTKHCHIAGIPIERTVEYFMQYIKEIWFTHDTNIDIMINPRSLMIEMMNVLYTERTIRYTPDFVMVDISPESEDK